MTAAWRLCDLQVKYTNGDVFDGEWVSGSAVRGCRTCAQGPHSGDRYEGEWTEGKFHGRGCYHFSGGDRHEGEYRSGQSHRSGIYKWVDGTTYDGEYRHGSKLGMGTETGANERYTVC